MPLLYHVVSYDIVAVNLFQLINNFSCNLTLTVFVKSHAWCLCGFNSMPVRAMLFKRIHKLLMSTKSRLTCCRNEILFVLGAVSGDGTINWNDLIACNVVVWSSESAVRPSHGSTSLSNL